MYQAKQTGGQEDTNSAMINKDVLDTVLLSLHPPEMLDTMELSAYTREGLAELRQFHNLILLARHRGYAGQGARSEGPAGHHKDLQNWLKNLPSNYTAMLTIMGWFLTLSSKMTGYTIPGISMAPGGKIEHDRSEVDHYLEDMETMADAMANEKNWNLPQYAILREMHRDLKRIHYSFQHNRNRERGTFDPMSQLEEPDDATADEAPNDDATSASSDD